MRDTLTIPASEVADGERHEFVVSLRKLTQVGGRAEYSPSPPSLSLPRTPPLPSPPHGLSPPFHYRSLKLRPPPSPKGAPYGTGIGMKLLQDSVLQFIGLEALPPSLKPFTPAPGKRAIEWIGASDTAGYCVDGTPDTDGTADLYVAWEVGGGGA